MKLHLAFVLALTAFQLHLYSEMSQGEKLERQMWNNMLYRNFKDVEEAIAEPFQSVHTFGARGPKEELEIIKNLYLGSYEMSDVKSTETPDTIIITYMISAPEKIDNQHLSAKAAPRMSVWQKFNNQWKWIAHANLKEVPPEKRPAPEKEKVNPEVSKKTNP